MRRKPLILIVDDDVMSLKLLRVHLNTAEYDIITANDGQQAVELFDDHQPDLVILDMLMPQMDGLAAVQRIREQSIVPIIIVTAVGEEHSVLQAFELGVDDYLTKPYRHQELIARVRAVLRRASWHAPPASKETIRFGAVEIRSEDRRVLRNGRPVALTATEYKLLIELATNPGRIMTHEMLLQRVWGKEYRDEAEYLRVYISRLRRKLEEDPTRPRHFLTEIGVGYRFDPDNSHGAAD